MSIIKRLSSKNPKCLTIDVQMTDDEVEECFKNCCKSQNNFSISTNYYSSYLKHVLGTDYDTADIESIFVKLDFMKEYVTFCLSKSSDKQMVIDCLKNNKYFSKNISRPGVTVKLFAAEYNGKTAVVKTYMYDGHSQELKWSLEQNIKNEILFQNYAKTLNKKLDFISPELYAWGEIRGYKPFEDSHKYKVMYLIMEYIPFIQLKDISQMSNITEIYERVDILDKELKSQLLHHNDLHSSNILVSCRSPLPDLCILDFGESSCGPRKRIE
jgi:serine/threonine protein kinase